MYGHRIGLLIIFLTWLAPHARAQNASVSCQDGTKTVKLVIQFGKSAQNPPIKISITSNGKSKEVDPKSVSRFIRNANDFYVLFKVQTKVGPHDIELNTRFDKKSGGKKSAGVMTNKTQDERVNVTCQF